MRIDEILAAGGPVFSFEFFPPKTERGERNLYAALAELRTLEPSFVSVTYGAGGSTREKTIEIVKRIREEYGLEAMAHFTCVGATVDELRATLEEMAAAGIDNVLALRGDPPAGAESWTKTEGGLEYSRELVELIAGGYPFAIGAACFPETHIHAQSPEADLGYLAEKVGAGVDFLITQLFFENSLYFDFLARARAAGIETPIIPGIMPITHAGQVERMAKMCGSSIPEGLRRELRARGDHPEAVLDFGVAYATLQCAELLAAGAPGIHFYTLNRSPATRAILSALKLVKPWEQAISASAAISSSPASVARGEPLAAAQPASISSPSATRGEPSAAS
jgi:methylenetetrahydrofolate reductase (NADPH)